MLDNNDYLKQKGCFVKKLNIQLLLTGNELMVGDVIDTNSVMIAQQLMSLGLTVQRKVTVADDIELLIAEIVNISKQADILIINGGLGPTVDDLTAQALAQASKVPLVEHTDALEHLNKWCTLRGAKLDAANLKQAILPAGSDIIANRVGSAVGFELKHQQCNVYCTPGVPHELKIMMDEQIIPKIQEKVPNSQHYKVERFQVFGVGESQLQQLINDTFEYWPEAVELGFRAASPLLEVKLTIKQKQDEAFLAQCRKMLKQILGDHMLAQVTGTPLTMADYVLAQLIDKKLKITTAESCTGGEVASLLTNIPGSSKAFEAGFVTYSNEMKTQMIDVSADTLSKFGAVSEQVVAEMAQGALEKSGADYVIAVSGIAGPDGGSVEKPVGSVWLAWGNKAKIKTHYFCIKANRKYFQKVVATRALDLVRRELLASTEPPNYLI